MLFSAIFLVGCGVTYSYDNTSYNRQSALDEEELNSFEIDWQDFLGKIWITDDWIENRFNLLSFRLDEIKNGSIFGVVKSSDAAFPPVFRAVGNQVHSGQSSESNIILTVQSNKAYGYFELPDGTKGAITIEAKEKGVISAIIELACMASRHSTYELFEGNFIYRPLNISDMPLSHSASFVEDKNLSFRTNLDVWGYTYFRVGTREGNRSIPVIYLTDYDGNILYSFEAAYQSFTYVYEIIVKDLNANGLLDVTIVTTDGVNERTGLRSRFYWHFYQLESSWFLLERGEFLY